MYTANKYTLCYAVNFNVIYVARVFLIFNASLLSDFMDCRSRFLLLLLLFCTRWFFSGVQDADPVAVQIRESTEEGKKVSRNHGNKWEAVFRRIEDTYDVNETTAT